VRVQLPRLPKLTSEDVEPTMTKIMCHLYERCENAKGDDDHLHHACNCLWEAMRAISMISICLRPAFGNDASCLHFSIAANNEMGKAAKYIETMIGIDPYKEWMR
jgi:hypothetical protein